MKNLLFILSIIISHFAFGQQSRIDSLLNVLKTTKQDTTKVNTYNNLFLEVEFTDETKAKEYLKKALELSHKIDFKKGLGITFLYLGYLAEDKGNYPDALKNYFTTLKISEAIGDKKGIATSYLNIGNANYRQGNYPEALKSHFASLKIREAIGDKKGVASSYNNIGLIYRDQGNYAEALKNHFAALKIRKSIDDKYGMADSYGNIGIVYHDQGNYPQALKNLFATLKIKESIGDKFGMSAVYDNIGNIYSDLGNYPEALKNHFASLKIEESIGAKYGIASSYNNIGSVYFRQSNYPEALKNYFVSLRILEKIGDKKGISLSYNNIGGIYADQGNYIEALKNHFAALKIREELVDKKGTAASYNNIAYVYSQQSNYPEALKNYYVSLRIREEIGDKKGISESFISIGKVKLKLNKASEAQKYLEDALVLSIKIRTKEQIRNAYDGLAQVDSAMGNYKSQVANYKLYILYRDSLDNEETRKKTIQSQMKYEYETKEAVVNAEHKKELENQEAIAEEKNRKQNIIIWTVVIGLLLVAVFTGYIFKEKKKSEELLLNILPEEVAEELKRKGSADAKLINEVTVLFTDFKGFTQLSEKLTAKELVNEINECFSAFDFIMEKHNVEKIKTIGDAYMAAGGLPTPNLTHASDVLNAALDIQQFMLEHKKKKQIKGEVFFDIRIGVHSGSVVAGIVGVKKFSYDIWGDTVNTASRMESSGEPGKINISGTTYELVKDKFECTHRGKIQAKGKGELDMYFVEERI